MSSIFRTEGPLLETESHLYVERDEDGRIAADIRRGDYVALTGARQTGKTSLLWRLRRQLLDEGHIPVYLDLSPARDRDEEAWYRYFHDVMLAQLGGDAPDVSVPPMQDQFDFREALRRIALELPPSRQIIIMLDEVSSLPLSISDLFFGTVRAMFNEREAFPAFRRYVFVMAGAFIPDELVRDPSLMPFNVASRVYVSDADREGLAGLVRNLERAGCIVSDQVIDRIYHWTAGHLYLTQRLCSLLEAGQETHLTPGLVDEAVDVVLGDRHIRRVYDRLDRSPEERRVLRRILTGDDPLKFHRASRLVARLELMGLIKADAEGYCTVRNAIYREALADGHLDGGKDQPDELTKLEQRLFEYFSRNVTRICSYSEVADAVWGNGSAEESGIEDRIYQLVARLRRKMASTREAPLQIVTIRGRGYRPLRRA